MVGHEVCNGLQQWFKVHRDFPARPERAPFHFDLADEPRRVALVKEQVGRGLDRSGGVVAEVGKEPTRPLDAVGREPAQPLALNPARLTETRLSGFD